MELNDYSLRQMDENDIRKLPEAALRDLAVKLLQDLKEARERLNQNSRNSSRPPGSDAPWENIGGNLENDSDDDDAAEGGGEDTEVSEASGDAEEVGVEQTEVGRLGDDTSDQTDAKMLKRNPGKQPGAPGFGRQQQLPVSACEEHRPTHCACCGKGFKEVASDSHAYTGFYTLDIEWGDPEAPGLRVTNTQHIYHETRCECGHLTREEPGSQPRDDLLPGVALSEWRLVGPGLSALIVCLAYRMRLSRQRIVEFLSDWFGIQLSVGTVPIPLWKAVVRRWRWRSRWRMICATVAYCISTKPAGERAALYYGSGCLPPVRPWCSGLVGGHRKYWKTC